MNESFSQRLRMLIPPGMSHSEFAYKIGVSYSGLKNWLSGEAEPNLRYARNISKFAGVSIDWLATGEGEKEAGAIGNVRSGSQLFELDRINELWGWVISASIIIFEEVDFRPTSDEFENWCKMAFDLALELDQMDETGLSEDELIGAAIKKMKPMLNVLVKRNDEMRNVTKKTG